MKFNVQHSYTFEPANPAQVRIQFIVKRSFVNYIGIETIPDYTYIRSVYTDRIR